MLRWKGGNPEETDLVSFRNLLGALPKGLKRMVFTSSAGVERQGSFPYVILNLFGATLPLCNCQSGHAA
jgi:nucleoside-diphosphate-sugar epimerase